MMQVNKKTINIRGRLMDLSAPVVMGILNITDDSFYAASRAAGTDQIIEKAGQMHIEGASMLDIGGYSTRPGAREIEEAEEVDRIALAVEVLTTHFPDMVISVDTFRSEVAKQAVRLGAHLINDVSGGTLDEKMFDTAAALGVPYILMHMRGTPATMKSLTVYDRLIPDIVTDLKTKIEVLRQKGVADIIIDPGFGFAKTVEQNFQLLNRLSEFLRLGYPVLAGLSRKTTIYKTLGTTPENALNGTSILNTLALNNGASILRVHDVKAAVEAVKLWTATAGYANKMVI